MGRKGVGLIAIAILFFCGCRLLKGRERTLAPAPPRAQAKQTLLAFVPCGFQRAAAKLVPEFERQHPNIRVEMHVDNILVLLRRILKKGERPDIFLSKGDKEAELLERKGVVQWKKTFCFVTLSLIVPADNPAKVAKLEDLTRPSVKTIGLGTEETSVGVYGRQLLKEAGLWERVKPKVVEIRFPVQLLYFTAAGKADAAIHYTSCVLVEPKEGKVKAVQTFIKGERCITIACPALVIKGSEKPHLGRMLADFLTTPFAQKVLKEHGFLTLSEAKCF